MFKKELGQGQAGDNCGILLRGVKRDEVTRGQVHSRSLLAMDRSLMAIDRSLLTVDEA